MAEYAFPFTEKWRDLAHDVCEDQHTGMTLRDWFAGQALAGMAAAEREYSSDAAVAMVAYRVADAMMKARGQTDV